MSARRQIHAAIFDMDGLLIDSEPLWDKAELEVMASLGVDISRRHEMPDILGLRIDLVVDLWFAQQPWKGRPGSCRSHRADHQPRHPAGGRSASAPPRCAGSGGDVQSPGVENWPGVGFAAADAGKSPHHV